MSLFGKSRDMSIFRHLNRELMGSVISQQCAYYKIDLKSTEVNIYGEAEINRTYLPPILLDALIKVGEQSNPMKENIGPDFSWNSDFSFLKDDLVKAKLLCEVGDIILYQETYFEVDTINSNQFFMGKDPDYPYQLNTSGNQLDQFGYNVSIVCKGHAIPQDKTGINRARL